MRTHALPAHSGLIDKPTPTEDTMNEQTTIRIDPAAVQAARARLAGDLVLPDDPGWDEARQAWNLAVDQRPAAVALPESAGDVVAAVRFAREQGLRIAPQGTGHNAPPLGPLDDTLLLKTSRMRGVQIDADAKRVRVEAGVLWLEVVEAAAEHGLAALAGSSPDVGVVVFLKYQKRKRLIEAALAETDVPADDYVFYVMVGAEGPWTPTGLAARLEMPLSTVLFRLCRLERRGDVERVPHPEDGRSFLVRLTPEGERLLGVARPVFRQHAKAVEARFGEARVGELRAVLAELRDAMETELAALTATR
jgi:DNA-binding MarR family transcriptional regulator